MDTTSLPERSALALAWMRVIREQRKSLGMTQSQLAEACSVEQATVSKWEHAIIAPSAAAQARLVKALGIPQDRWYRIQQEAAA